MSIDLEGAPCLVAGGRGFIGINLIRRLLDEGARVRATLHGGDPILIDDRIEYMRADLREEADCARAVDGMRYIFAAAASTAGAAVMARTPLVQVTPNVVLNARLLEAAYEAKARKFLFISSSAAYPPTEDHAAAEDEMFAGDPYDVYFAVGWMKRYAEILCRTYAEKIREPMACAVIRPSNAFGPYDKFDPSHSHVTAALIRRVVTREDPMEIWGTGDDRRDLIYIDDLIDGMLAVFGTDEPYAAVNIASGETHSVKEILNLCIEIDGYADPDIRFDASKPRTIRAREIDTTHARTAYGYQPRVSLRDGLANTIAWFRENRNSHPR